MATPTAPAQDATVEASSQSTSQNSVWSCKVDSSPKDEKGFTVGEVFELDCTGPAVVLKEPLKLKLPEKSEYVLALLKPVAMTDNHVRYQATGYMPGDFKLTRLDVIDSEGHGFVIDSLNLKVQSVIDPQKPPQEPFGPLAPYRLEFPMWLFFSGAVVLLVIAAWILVYFRQRLQKKLLEKNIKKFQSPMGSYHQFSKDLRLLKRGVVFSDHVAWQPAQVRDFLTKLNESFRLFILREFTVPATTWSSRLIVRSVKKKNREAYPKYRHELLKAFKELDRALGNTDTLKSQDCEQLTQICWQAVDLIWKTKNASKTMKENQQ